MAWQRGGELGERGGKGKQQDRTPSPDVSTYIREMCCDSDYFGSMTWFKSQTDRSHVGRPRWGTRTCKPDVPSDNDKPAFKPEPNSSETTSLVLGDYYIASRYPAPSSAPRYGLIWRGHLGRLLRVGGVDPPWTPLRVVVAGESVRENCRRKPSCHG